MRGPIVSSDNTKTPIYYGVSQSVTGVPAGTSTPQNYRFDYSWAADTFAYKLGYRSAPSVAWLNRPRPQWSYVWPTPYDAYGVKFRKRPYLSLKEHRKTINTTPWAAPWREQHRVTSFEGLPQGVPLALLPQLPQRTYEGALVTRALASAADVKANLAVTIRETRETGRMMGRRVKKMADFIKLLRKGNFYAAARLLGLKHPPATVHRTRNWADNLLEFQNGWLPLIADTIGYAQYLADFLNEHEVLTSRAFVVINKSSSTVRNGISLGKEFPGYSMNLGIITDDEEVHRVVLNFRLKDALKRELAQLALLDPVSYGFETGAFSYVLNWSIKVQQYLEATNALLGLEFHSGTYTRMVRRKASYKMLSLATPGASYPTSIVSLQGSMEPGESNSYVVRREVYQDLPPPQLVVQIFGTAESTILRSIHSAALLRQNLSFPNSHFLPRK